MGLPKHAVIGWFAQSVMYGNPVPPGWVKVNAKYLSGLPYGSIDSPYGYNSIYGLSGGLPFHYHAASVLHVHRVSQHTHANPTITGVTTPDFMWPSQWYHSTPIPGYGGKRYYGWPLVSPSGPREDYQVHNHTVLVNPIVAILSSISSPSLILLGATLNELPHLRVTYLEATVSGAHVPGNAIMFTMSPGGVHTGWIPCDLLNNRYLKGVEEIVGTVVIADTAGNKIICLGGDDEVKWISGYVEKPNAVALQWGLSGDYVKIAQASVSGGGDDSGRISDMIYGGQTPDFWASGYDNPLSLDYELVLTNIWVADTDNNQIVKTTWSFRELFRKNGFNAPKSVSCLQTFGSGCWVADTGNNQVVRLSALGVEEVRIGGLNQPNCVSASGGQECYVADTGHNRVVKTSGGQLLVIRTGLNSPASVSYGGGIWIADTGNNRVIVMHEGDSIYITGLSAPTVVAANIVDGSCWVLDSGGTRVSHIAGDGEILWQYSGIVGALNICVNPYSQFDWGGTLGDVSSVFPNHIHTGYSHSHRDSHGHSAELGYFSTDKIDTWTPPYREAVPPAHHHWLNLEEAEIVTQDTVSTVFRRSMSEPRLVRLYPLIAATPTGMTEIPDGAVVPYWPNAVWGPNSRPYIPMRWEICTGSPAYPGSPPMTPDLVGKFIQGTLNASLVTGSPFGLGSLAHTHQILGHTHQAYSHSHQIPSQTWGPPSAVSGYNEDYPMSFPFPPGYQRTAQAVHEHSLPDTVTNAVTVIVQSTALLGTTSATFMPDHQRIMFIMYKGPGPPQSQVGSASAITARTDTKDGKTEVAYRFGGGLMKFGTGTHDSNSPRLSDLTWTTISPAYGAPSTIMLTKDGVRHVILSEGQVAKTMDDGKSWVVS